MLASDPFTVASTFEGPQVLSREECSLTCEYLTLVASHEVCYPFSRAVQYVRMLRFFQIRSDFTHDVPYMKY